jgi:capsule polysaccharide export protein KpsE/RkpR
MIQNTFHEKNRIRIIAVALMLFTYGVFMFKGWITYFFLVVCALFISVITFDVFSTKTEDNQNLPIESKIKMFSPENQQLFHQWKDRQREKERAVFIQGY